MMSHVKSMNNIADGSMKRFILLKNAMYTSIKMNGLMPKGDIDVLSKRFKEIFDLEKLTGDSSFTTEYLDFLDAYAMFLDARAKNQRLTRPTRTRTNDTVDKLIGMVTNVKLDDELRDKVQEAIVYIKNKPTTTKIPFEVYAVIDGACDNMYGPPTGSLFITSKKFIYDAMHIAKRLHDAGLVKDC